ncbi:MAG: hypothetical protein IKN55_07910 [Oscillospiraceae bacterium]|nr:hypothetical protein [Oscillospiraceae bacterium]
MNGEKLLRAMNGIDEQYLAQALEPAAKPKTRRRSIVAVVSIAAAAILMTTAVDAGYQLTHPESVAHWLTGGSGQMLADKELVLNEVYENAHYRVTAETLLSDGFMADLILTAEPLDAEASPEMPDIHQSRAVLCYTDGGEVEGSACGSGTTALQGSTAKQVYFLLDRLEPGRPTEVRFELYSGAENEENPLEGIVIPVDLTPNVETLACRSEEDGVIYVSPFEMHSDTIQLNVPLPSGHSDIRLLRNNGIPLLVDYDSTLLHGLEPSGGWYTQASEGRESMSCIEFRELIDISDFCGVQVGDTVYQAQ